MTDLALGTHEFMPQDLLDLVQQYDFFVITHGSGSFMQIRVPTNWVKLDVDHFGAEYLTCRNKRKRDGHLFVMYGNKFIFNIERNDDRLIGKLKTDLCDDEFDITMLKLADKN